jgi:hypothetical protein
MRNWTQPIYPDELLLDDDTKPKDRKRILEEAQLIDRQREAPVQALMNKIAQDGGAY